MGSAPRGQGFSISSPSTWFSPALESAGVHADPPREQETNENLAVHTEPIQTASKING